MRIRYVLGLLAVISAMSSCSRKGGDAAEHSGISIPEPEPTEVRVQELRLSPFPVQVVANGKLSAVRKAAIYFENSGNVRKIYVGNGDSVGQGAVLAEQDNELLRIAADVARTEKEKARLEYYDFLAGLGYGVGDSLVIPADVVSVARLRSGYEAAENSFRRASYNLAATSLKAPFSGKVADLTCREGERTGSDPFCTIVDCSSYYVEFSILESELPYVGPDQRVKLSSFADPSKTADGKVRSVNPVVDENGQIKVRALASAGPWMMDGMNVKVVVEKQLPSRMAVPKTAVVVRDGEEVVFRYNSGKAEWVYVKTTGANSESCTIVANERRGGKLSDGDMIIVDGNLNLADGSSVTLAVD